jgi:hypothetical protein
VIVGRLRRHFDRKRRARHRELMARHSEFLEKLRMRRFPESDAERFALLWCEMAEVCGLSPVDLREDLELASLRSAPRSWLSLSDRLEDLNYLVLVESRELAPPRPKPTTIGGVLDYLLNARGEEIITD